ADAAVAPASRRPPAPLGKDSEDLSREENREERNRALEVDRELGRREDPEARELRGLATHQRGRAPDRRERSALARLVEKDPLEREPHVSRGERAAVVEAHA